MSRTRFRHFGREVTPPIKGVEESKLGFEDLVAYARAAEGVVGGGWPVVEARDEAVHVETPTSDVWVRPNSDSSFDVGMFPKKPPTRKVDGKVEEWPSDAPVEGLWEADAETALAYLRGTVNDWIRQGPDPESDEDNPVEDGFAARDDAPREAGTYVTNPFACGGMMSPCNPEAEYGEAYREWRDNPPLPKPTAAPGG